MNGNNVISAIVVITCFVTGYALVSYVWKKVFAKPTVEKTSSDSENVRASNSRSDRSEVNYASEGESHTHAERCSESDNDAHEHAEHNQESPAMDGATDVEQYYASVLGLRGRVSRDDIRTRYLQLASQYHPDKVHHLGPKLRQLADEEMKKINEAYQFLRNRYDI
jgi:DnaJ-domain-containing protein 1